MQTAIKAMQLGAFEYLTKPLSIAKVRESIHRVLKSIQSTPVKRTSGTAYLDNRYQIIGDSVVDKPVSG